MRGITGLFFVMSMAGYLLLVWQKFKIRSWFVPLVTISGISLILYLGGLLGILGSVADGLLAGGVMCLVWQGIRLRRMPVSFWMPGISMICLILGSLIFLVIVADQNLIHYDNFSHWALIVKYLLSTGKYPGVSDALISFKDYPPGTAVWIYYVCRFLGHGEGVMLTAQTGMILSAFSAVFGIVRESRRFLLYAFLAVGCSMLSYLNLTIRINNLLVDFLLPVLSLAAISIAARYRQQPVKACLCCGVVIGITGIVKSTGVFFGALAYLCMIWMVGRSRKIRLRTRLTALAAAGGLSVCPWLLWQYHVAHALAGTEHKFDLTASAEALKPADQALYEQIVRTFLQEGTALSSRPVQAFLVCSLLAVAAYGYVKFFLHRRWKLLRTFFLATVIVLIYYAGILGLYLFSMPEEEAVRLAGFERYASSIIVWFAGILILQAETDMERSFAVDIDERGGYMAYSSPEAKRRYQYGVLICLVAAVNFLYSEINGLLQIQQGYVKSLPGRVRQIVGDRWYDSGCVDERRYLVAASDRDGQVSDWSVWYVCRYFLFAPNVEVTEKVKAEELEDYDYVVVLEEEAADADVGIYPMDEFRFFQNSFRND